MTFGTPIFAKLAFETPRRYFYRTSETNVRPFLFILTIFAFVPAGVGGCVPSEQFVRTELCFGLARPDSGFVSEQEWQTFVDLQIATRFPDGFTVISAQGKWRSPQTGETVNEPSRVVIIVHPNSSSAGVSIDSIRAIYKLQFHQEAVLKVVTPARVSF